MPITINGNNVNVVIFNNSTVDAVTINGNQVFPDGPSYPPYLTFSSASAFTLETVLNDAPWDGTMEYSTDATNWTTWGGEAINSSANGGVHYLYVRGSGNTVVSGGDSGIWMFGGGSGIYCDGDIRTLLDYSDPENTTMAQSCFYYLFSESPLVRAPDLPSETLSNSCYAMMFANCSSLTKAPNLPAKTLQKTCYSNMFSGCTALATCPSISATVSNAGAMMRMFFGCTALATLPTLQMLNFAANVCNSMFSGCQSIKISETQTGDYQTPYRIPADGTGTTTGAGQFTNMFMNTGGTFTDSPTINITYYTSNTIVG